MDQTRLPRWLERLDEPDITGLYLAYVDLWTWLRARFRRLRARGGA